MHRFGAIFSSVVMVFVALSLSACEDKNRVERLIRLKADYLYMGEPFTAEYIYNCSVKTRQSIGGGSTIHEENPVRYAYWKLPDDSVIGTELPLVCANSTFKDIPDDFMPRLNWFEDETTNSGFEYVTGAAYDSPLSRFKFLGAEVTRATQQDMKAWRARNEIEVVNHSRRGGAALIGDFSKLQFQTVSGFRREFPEVNSVKKRPLMVMPLGLTGVGFKRYPMPEGMLELSEEYWPEGAGRYWAIDSSLYYEDPVFKEFQSKFYDVWDGGVYPDVARPQHYYIGGSQRETIGLDGAGVSRSKGRRDKYVLPDFFPLFPYSKSMPETEMPSEYYHRNIVTDPNLNGFGVIQRLSVHYRNYNLDIGIDQMQGPLDFDLTFDPDGSRKQHFIYIDGEAVYPSLLIQKPQDPNKYSVTTPDYILDRTGFIFD